MPWRASTLTTLRPGQRVSINVLADLDGQMVSDLSVAATVVATEPCLYVAIPWATWLAGGRRVPDTLLLDWENFAKSMRDEICTTHIPVGDGCRSERITLLVEVDAD